MGSANNSVTSLVTSDRLYKLIHLCIYLSALHVTNPIAILYQRCKRVFHKHTKNYLVQENYESRCWSVYLTLKEYKINAVAVENLKFKLQCSKYLLWFSQVKRNYQHWHEKFSSLTTRKTATSIQWGLRKPMPFWFAFFLKVLTWHVLVRRPLNFFCQTLCIHILVI